MRRPKEKSETGGLAALFRSIRFYNIKSVLLRQNYEYGKTNTPRSSLPAGRNLRPFADRILQ
jgi:hypothetical protein